MAGTVSFLMQVSGEAEICMKKQTFPRVYRPRFLPLGHRIKRHQCLKQPRQVLERDHVGARRTRVELSGSWWVSMNTPATPTATAARASVSTKRRSPPEVGPLAAGLLPPE